MRGMTDEWAEKFVQHHGVTAPGERPGSDRTWREDWDGPSEPAPEPTIFHERDGERFVAVVVTFGGKIHLAAQYGDGWVRVTECEKRGNRRPREWVRFANQADVKRAASGRYVIAGYPGAPGCQDCDYDLETPSQS